MIRLLLYSACRPRTNLRTISRSFSENATETRRADTDEENKARRAAELATLERNVKRRILSIAKSLDMPQAQLPSSTDIVNYKAFLNASVENSLWMAANWTSTKDPVQPWLLMYLLVMKIRSPVHTALALNVIYSNLHSLPNHIQPFILVLTTQALANVQTAPPMGRVVETFLHLPGPTHHLHFNLFLRAMSPFRQSEQLSKLTVTILDAMQARGMRLTRATYNSLLANRFVTLELTKRLRARMAHEGLKPTVKELEQFIRFFGKHGAAHTSAKYLNEIRHLKIEQGKPAPHGAHILPIGVQVESSGDSVATSHNTHFIRSLVHYPSSAFQYLRNLVAEHTVHVSAIEEEQKLVAPSHPKFNGPGPGVYDWTAALHAAARDKRISGDTLLALFERGRKAGLRPTAATYTVVMHGLIKKNKNYTAALALWKRLRKSPARHPDKMVVTVGVEVLIGAGLPLKAFDLILEETTTNNTAVKRGRKAHRDIALVNAFMGALGELGWPAAVFLCWDSLESLFDVRPDAVSLTILLRAAKVAERADRSMRGLLGHISLYNPFRSSDSRDFDLIPSLPSYEIESRIRSCLETKTVEDKPSTTSARTSSLWSGAPAGHKALRIFRSILLTNFAHLNEVQAPAKAVWSDSANDTSPLHGMAKGLGLSRSHFVAAKSSASLSSAQFLIDSQLQISPDGRTFHAYIMLLGHQRRSSEIPLALAWMRELGLQPLKETLSFALVFFAEVGLRGPLLETYGEMSEYKKLIAWLAAWLGQNSLPTDSQIRRAIRVVKRERGGLVSIEEDSFM